MALTQEQIERANQVLDWFNAEMAEVEMRDPWKARGEIGPSLVTLQDKRELLATLDITLGAIHTMAPGQRCGCGKCGR